MILELGDGRELQFPDEMPDASALLLKRLILTLEERARTAESEVRILRDEMAALRLQLGTTQQKSDSTAAAMRDLQQEVARGSAAIVRAVLSDRVLVTDQFDRAYSRVVK